MMSAGELVGLAGLLWSSYICCGVAVGYRNGRRGAEALPHLHFWVDLEELCRDGARFSWACWKRMLVGRRGGYASIGRASSGYNGYGYPSSPRRRAVGGQSAAAGPLRFAAAAKSAQMKQHGAVR
jgi:hypothetical protein